MGWGSMVFSCCLVFCWGYGQLVRCLRVIRLSCCLVFCLGWDHVSWESLLFHEGYEVLFWDSAVLGTWESVSFEVSCVEPFAYCSWCYVADFGDLSCGVDFHFSSLLVWVGFIYVGWLGLWCFFSGL